MPRISGLVSGPLSLAALLALGAIGATGCASSTTTTLTNDEEDVSSPAAGRATVGATKVRPGAHWLRQGRR